MTNPDINLEGSLTRIADSSDRQCDNMAFILNHMTMPDQWYEKFTDELAEDRKHLAYIKAIREAVPILDDSYHRMNDIKANLRTHVEFNHATVLMAAVGSMAVAAKLLHTITKERD